MSDLELTMMRRVGELKAEVERLKKFNDEAMAHIAKEERKSRERLDIEQAENARLKAEVDRLAECEGYHYTAIAISMLKEQLQQKNIDYVEARKANEAKVEMIKSLKAEVEELKSQPDPLTVYLYADTLRRDDIKTLKAHIERLTKAGDAMADMVDWEVPYERRKKLEAAWKAAKEGKQS
jgi:hypothetical protein